MYVVAANIVIAHPGQDVELSCSLDTLEGTGWLIGNIGPYGVNALLNGLVDGYSADINTNSIKILNIVMNDDRNGTEYQCGIISGSLLEQERPSITLYVAGEFQ